MNRYLIIYLILIYFFIIFRTPITRTEEEALQGRKGGIECVRLHKGDYRKHAR